MTTVNHPVSSTIFDSGGIRRVTDYEVRSCRENGWVRVPGLLTTNLAGQMLDGSFLGGRSCNVCC